MLCRNVVIESPSSSRIAGNGLWFDIGNEKCVVRNCLIADNEDAGIFYEISYGLHAHDNVIIGNGFRETPGAWGAGAGDLALLIARLRHRAEPDRRQQRGLRLPRAGPQATPRIDDGKERGLEPR